MVALLCGWVRFSAGQSSTKPLHIGLKPFAQKSRLVLNLNHGHPLFPEFFQILLASKFLLVFKCNQKWVNKNHALPARVSVRVALNNVYDIRLGHSFHTKKEFPKSVKKWASSIPDRQAYIHTYIRTDERF